MAPLKLAAAEVGVCPAASAPLAGAPAATLGGVEAAAEPAAVPATVPLSLEQLFLRYSRYVAAIGLRLLGRDDEIDDLVQDVFVAAATGLERLRDAEAIRGYLASASVRLARRKLWRRRLYHLVGLEQPWDYQGVAARGASAEDRVLLAEVYRALDRLPVEMRVAWSLRYLENEPLEKVAEQLGCSLATAKRRIAAAQERLDRRLHG
jgi:RNA polymerase sigma-70 factor (ECF subfamily)